MTLTESATEAIRSDLITGIETTNRHRRKRYRNVVLAPLLAVVATAGFYLSIGDPEPAFALMQAADGTIRVEVYPDFDQVDELQQALDDAGLETIIVHLKGHPSLDGLVEVTSHGNEQSEVFEFDNGEFVIEPASVQGNIEILIYSAAAEGEPYQFAPSIFSSGQELAGLPCAYSEGPLSTAELELRANQVGITDIEWVLFDRSAPEETGSESAERPIDAAVLDAGLASAQTLRVIASMEVDGPASETLRMTDGTHHRESIVCTPELAAQWE